MQKTSVIITTLLGITLSSCDPIENNYNCDPGPTRQTAGSVGPMGLIGPTGPQGIEGPVGPIGPVGLPGATGPVGPAGFTGLIGLTGATGPVGPTGLPGVNAPLSTVDTVVLYSYSVQVQPDATCREWGMNPLRQQRNLARKVLVFLADNNGKLLGSVDLVNQNGLWGVPTICASDVEGTPVAVQAIVLEVPEL